MLIQEVWLIMSLFILSNAVHMNSTDFKLVDYLQGLTDLSPTTDLLAALITTPCGLAPIHCNRFCNGTTTGHITPRQCSSSLPDCKPCNCDNDCLKFGDCCPNHRGEVPEKTETNYKCIGNDLNNLIFFTGISNAYYMKHSCLTSTSASKKLQDYISPVTSQLTNITYKNKFIAKCNNEDDVIEWNIDDICKRKKPKYRPLYCVIFVSPPANVSVRKCDLDLSEAKIIVSCNITGLWDGQFPNGEVQTDCDSCHHYPVQSAGLVFKNIYCYMCNGLSPSIYRCVSNTPFLNSVNDLVSIYFDPERPTCITTEWYDRKKNVCRRMSCRSGYLLDDQSCVMSNFSLSQVQYHFDALFWPTTAHRSDPLLQNWTYVETMVVKSLPESFTNLNLSYFVMSVTNLVSIIDTNDTVDLPSFGVNLLFKSKTNYSRTDFERSVENLTERVWILSYNDSEYHFTVTNRNQFNFGISHSSTYNMISNDLDLEKLNTFSLLPVHTDWDPSDEYIVFPRVMPPCAHVYLHIDDFKENLNGSITLQYADIVIPSENLSFVQYRMFAVCVDTLVDLYAINENPIDPHKNAEAIVSIVFSILSLICLALTFLTYCTFPSLLSLPIRNTMFLVAFMFLGQLLLLFSGLARRDATACTTIGVFLHYIWLSVFLWMNVCSFHMFRVFVIDASKPPSAVSSNKQLRRYCLYANLLPAIIVLITIIANLATSSGSHTGYGGSRCYLSSFLNAVIAFVIPIAIVLAVNIVFFISSIFTMAKIHKRGASTVGQDKGQVHIYMKLSTLTGIFWLLSILAENLQLQVFTYISIIMNASQGVFIFLSYMVNKRVYLLWKKKTSAYVVCSQENINSSSSVSCQTISTRL